ncbi:MAG TPA: hypothetical protein DEP19_05265 [Anaerolineae bacterium]|nr:hypothetical protein [Anaerolineae bacterium]HCK65346.1 hypothetical protein [Anaerolineae bacterium]
MIDIFRDPIWQFVIGIVTLLVTIWLAMRSFAKKLSYEIIAQTTLVSITKENEKNRIKVLFDKKTIANAELLLIKIKNTGVIPIKSSDFETPLRLSLGKSARILSADIYDLYPSNLQISFEVESKSLKINPVLLNSKDSFTIKIIADSPSKVEVLGRIVGVKNINKFGESYSRRVVTTSFIYLVAGAFALWIASGFTDYKVPFLIVALGFSFFFGGVILPRLIAWIREGT